jgi:hypothetical protein
MLRIPHFLDNWLTEGGEVVSLTCQLRFITQKDILVLISVRGSVNLRAIVRLGGLGKWKGKKELQWPHWKLKPCPSGL